MYTNEELIQQQFDSFVLGFCGSLDWDNRWIQLAKKIPWAELEPLYTHHFNNHGRPAKRFRVALGTLIIQEMMKLTDREVIEAIAENVYLQFFLGFSGFRKTRPFDSSLLVYFRKRLNWESVAKINDIIAALPKKPAIDSADESQDDDQEGPTAGGSGTDPDNPYPRTLIIDATCTPADIRHPHDLTLLDEVRRTTEILIDHLCKANGHIKPRTYRKKARQNFLLSIKKRNKSEGEYRRAIGQQLRYIKRNLTSLGGWIKGDYANTCNAQGCLRSLSKTSYRNLLVAHEIYRQQSELYQRRSRSVAHRIVSMAQPHIRPIVRGKARSKVEFGAKISVATAHGMVFVDKISFDAYSESSDVILHAEAYRSRTGVYPDTILCDKAYQSRANRQWCEERNIRLMGKRLGRKFEDSIFKKAFDKIERMEEAERVEIEGKIGVQKRRYGWDLIPGKSPATAMTMIMLSALAGNLMTLLWKGLFFVHSLLSKLPSVFFDYLYPRQKFVYPRKPWSLEVS